MAGSGDGFSLTEGQWFRKLRKVLERLPERERRLVAALEAMRLGYGGTRRVARACGLDEKTIRRGRRELTHDVEGVDTSRQRRAGAGRPRAEKNIPTCSRTSNA